MNTQITEDYVSFETAKLLKEKGFNEYCRAYYKKYHIGFNEIYNSPQLIDNKSLFEMGLGLSAPTLQMARKWLRKIYYLEIYPYHDFPEVGDKWWFEIIKYPNSVSEYESETVYNSYEEVCEVAIKYCLENLI